MARSRYEGLPTSTVTVPDDAGGTREIGYLLQRAVPDPASVAVLTRHQVLADDRIDLVADRYLGDPQAFWRVCDANSALDPDDLVGPGNAGATIVVAVPEA